MGGSERASRRRVSVHLARSRKRDHEHECRRLMDGAAFAEHRVLGRWFSGLVGGGRTRLSPWPRLDDEGKRRAVRMPSLLRAHEVVHGTKLATNFSRIGRRARPQNSGPAIEGCSNPVRFTASLSKRFPQRALYFSQVSAIRRAMARSPTLG